MKIKVMSGKIVYNGKTLHPGDTFETDEQNARYLLKHWPDRYKAITEAPVKPKEVTTNG